MYRIQIALFFAFPRKISQLRAAFRISRRRQINLCVKFYPILHFEQLESLQVSYRQADQFLIFVHFTINNINAGGMIHFRDGANTQYVTGTAFLFMIYSDILAKSHQTVTCGAQEIQPARLVQFAKQQVFNFSVPYMCRSS